MSDWFKKLFINEAKPALERHSGGGGSGDSDENLISIISDLIECDATELDIPNGPTKIGNGCFKDKTALASVVIPDSVSAIGDNAFNNCTTISKIKLPKDLVSVGSYAFYKCSSLTSIDLPEGLTSIGNYAFHSCSNLKTIKIPQGLSYLDRYAFYGCSSLTSIDLPEGLTSIKPYALSNCSALASIELPTNLKTIEHNTFAGCSSLTSIDLPEGLTSIGERAFANCKKITTITIPENVSELGNEVFYGCSSLTTVNMLSVIPPKSGYSVFQSTALVEINVPSDGFKQYIEAEYWSHYKDKIVTTIFLDEVETKTVVKSIDSSIWFYLLYSGKNPSFTIESDNPEVCTARIDNDGAVYLNGDATGTANITVTLTVGDLTKTVTFSVNVIESAPEYTYSVENVEGAEYPFYQYYDGYYKSGNTNSETVAICRLKVNSNGVQKLFIDYEQDGGANGHNGVISNVDRTLSYDYYGYDEEESVLQYLYDPGCTTGTIELGVLPAGEHTIDIKFCIHWIDDWEWDAGTPNYYLMIKPRIV